MTVDEEQSDGWAGEVAAVLPGAVLEHPFGPDVDVYKVGGKMFALMSSGSGAQFCNLKAEPDDVAALVGAHDSVRRGWHMNKRHWVSVDAGGDVDDVLLAELVTDSWRLVVASLPRARRVLLEAELDAED